MKNYFIMSYDPPWAGPTPRRVSKWDVNLNLGIKLDDDPGLFEFILEVESNAPNPEEFKALDWHDPDKGHTLFSTRMQNVLKEAGVDNIDYYPAKVVLGSTGQVLEYKVANILGLISGLDREVSVFEEDEDGFIEEIYSMVFDESKFHDFKMFRLEEFENLIIVHKQLKDAIEKNSLTGMTFIEDEEWEPGII